MRKKQFLALAEAIKAHNLNLPEVVFTSQQIGSLADFCQVQNPEFKRDQWLLATSCLQAVEVFCDRGALRDH